MEGWTEAARFLVESGADVDVRNGKYTPMDRACMYGYIDMIELLIKHGANVDGFDRNHASSGTYLHSLFYGWSSDNVVEVVKVLLDHGADASRKDHLGYTPLNLAAARGLETVCQCMIDHGAKMTPYDLLALGSEAELMTRLQTTPSLINEVLDKKPNNVRASEVEAGTCLLDRAIALKQPQIAMKLLDLGADPDGPDPLKGMPLRTAARNGATEMVSELLERGADPNASDRTGWTALTWAGLRDHADIVDLLLSAGADPEAAELAEKGPKLYIP
jgi:ankyrin repeat protein